MQTNGNYAQKSPPCTGGQRLFGGGGFLLHTDAPAGAPVCEMCRHQAVGVNGEGGIAVLIGNDTGAVSVYAQLRHRLNGQALREG